MLGYRFTIGFSRGQISSAEAKNRVKSAFLHPNLDIQFVLTQHRTLTNLRIQHERFSRISGFTKVPETSYICYFKRLSAMSMPSSTSTLDGPRPLKVLMPIYNDFNTFDLNGPIEVLSQANRVSLQSHFQITLTAEARLTESIEHVRIERDISLTEAIARIDEWDILILCGGIEATIMTMVSDWREKKSGGGTNFMNLLEEYMSNTRRIVLTVCTGSLFLGALGRLGGRIATSHWGVLKSLEKLVSPKCKRRPCMKPWNGRALIEEDGREGAKIVRARWVDSPAQQESNNCRVITAGGVSCGVDATFYLMELFCGGDLATKVANQMDYQRRGEERQ